MKLSAVFMFAMVALSNNAFAIEDNLSNGTCETQKYLASLPDSTLFEINDADFGKELSRSTEIGACSLRIYYTLRRNGSDPYAEASFVSNGITIQKSILVPTDNHNSPIPAENLKTQGKSVMKAFRNALLNCGCTKL